MALGLRTVVAGCLLALVATLPPAVTAAAAAASLAVVSAPAYADDPTQVVVRLTDAGGAPIAGASVALERRAGGTWQPVGTLTTGPDGRASATQTVSRIPADNVVRASYDGAATEATLALRRRDARVTLAGPRSVVDGQQVTLAVSWRTEHGAPVAGTVTLWRRSDDGPWRRAARLGTDAAGRAALTVTPRQ